MKHQLLALSTLTATFFAAMAPSLADADDRKTYHGSQCQTTDGIETAYNRSEYRITRVSSAGSGNLMCPVVRDTFGCDALIGGCVLGSEARVRVYDAHTQGSVSCSFSSRNETGSSIYYSTDATNYGLSQGHDTLVMYGGWPTGNGTYSLRCQMPPNNGYGYTKLYGYMIEE